jgi:adenosylcobyric acid synthase
MSLRPLMVLGCTSDAGKSLLVTALARWFRRQGVDVAPFKAQNMSNNSRVVPGGEIGVAQWLQARAAGVAPSVDMNPVLLKPEADTRSQVVIAGVARRDVTEMPWRERGPHVWPAIAAAYQRLSARHDLILIEGAGSPAEINLEDLVNNRVLEMADASALLVADIDRGGSFAHLFGTWALVPDSTRNRLSGFVLNRFRGDESLLEPGPADLHAMTGMHPLGVIPMLDHHLPAEEGGIIRGRPPENAPLVAVVRAPFASNLDEFHLLGWAANMRWATRPNDLQGVDLVILPGSKHVAADRAWLRQQGLDAAIVSHARGAGRVLGICGGAMLLGSEVLDPHGVEGGTDGLALLPVTTRMRRDKVTVETTVTFPDMPSPWAALSGLVLGGYEIRNGWIEGDVVRLGADIWADGPVLATTVHGLLESPALLEALTGSRPRPVLEETFEQLADVVDANLDVELLTALVTGRPGESPGLP